MRLTYKGFLHTGGFSTGIQVTRSSPVPQHYQLTPQATPITQSLPHLPLNSSFPISSTELHNHMTEVSSQLPLFAHQSVSALGTSESNGTSQSPPFKAVSSAPSMLSQISLPEPSVSGKSNQATIDLLPSVDIDALSCSGNARASHSTPVMSSMASTSSVVSLSLDSSFVSNSDATVLKDTSISDPVSMSDKEAANFDVTGLLEKMLPSQTTKQSSNTATSMAALEVDNDTQQQTTFSSSPTEFPQGVVSQTVDETKNLWPLDVDSFCIDEMFADIPNLSESSVGSVLTNPTETDCCPEAVAGSIAPGLGSVTPQDQSESSKDLEDCLTLSDYALNALEELDLPDMLEVISDKPSSSLDNQSAPFLALDMYSTKCQDTQDSPSAECDIDELLSSLLSEDTSHALTESSAQSLPPLSLTNTKQTSSNAGTVDKLPISLSESSRSHAYIQRPEQISLTPLASPCNKQMEVEVDELPISDIFYSPLEQCTAPGAETSTASSANITKDRQDNGSQNGVQVKQNSQNTERWRRKQQKRCDKWITDRWNRFCEIERRESSRPSRCESAGIPKVPEIPRPLSQVLLSANPVSRKRPHPTDTEMCRGTKRQKVNTLKTSTDSCEQTIRKYSRTLPIAPVKPKLSMPQKATISRKRPHALDLEGTEEEQPLCKKVRISSAVESTTILTHTTDSLENSKKSTVSYSEETKEQNLMLCKRQNWAVSTLSPTKIILRRDFSNC